MGLSGADLELLRMQKEAGIDPLTGQGYDGAYLEQLGDLARVVGDDNLSANDIASFIATPDSAIETALSAKIGASAPSRWKATTAYTAGAVVMSPLGVLVQAKAAFTSGDTYDASRWRPVTDVNDWVGNLSDTSLQSWQWGTETRLHAASFGDSITQGAWAGPVELTDWPIKGWVGRFAQAMGRIYGDGGAGFIPLFRKEWVQAGTWVQIPDDGPMGYMFGATGSVSNTYTLTCYGDNADIFYQGNSAAWSYSIDGAAPVTVPAATAGNVATKINVALGAVDTHTVQISPAGAGYLYLAGAAAYIGSGGFVMHNFARSGASIADLSTQASRRLSLLNIIKPRLNFIGFVANDYSGQTALSTYESRLSGAATEIKQYGDTVLWAPPDNGITPVKTIATEAYEQSMKNVAATLGLPWIDIHAAWGDYTLTASKMYDTQHPNEAGHADIAARLLRAVRRLT